MTILLGHVTGSGRGKRESVEERRMEERRGRQERKRGTRRDENGGRERGRVQTASNND